jgi:hypothetical protein
LLDEYEINQRFVALIQNLKYESVEVTRMNEESHLDQEIVRLMDQVEAEKPYFQNDGYAMLNIQTGVAVLDGSRVDFAPKSLLDGKLSMILPTDFQEILPEKIYKPEFKPNLLLTDESGAIQITIIHTQKEVATDAEVLTYKNEVRQILRMVNSSLEWSEDGVKELQGKKLYFFEFITPMLGMAVYNLTFFLNLDQRVLSGSLVCNDQKTKSWKPVFRQMVDSLRVIAPDAEVVAPAIHPDFSEYSFNEGMYAVYQGQEYPLYQVGADQYRLVSTNPRDQETGFVKKDGVFKKTVTAAAISAAYQLKLTLIYRGYQFGLGQTTKSQVELNLKDGRSNIAQELQMELMGPREYVKWVAKSEIEGVITEKLAVAGFAMPETLTEN